MSHDKLWRGRLRAALADQAQVVEKQMFGGLAFLVKGRICVGIVSLGEH